MCFDLQPQPPPFILKSSCSQQGWVYWLSRVFAGLFCQTLLYFEFTFFRGADSITFYCTSNVF